MQIKLKARLLATALVLAPAAFFAAMPIDSAQAQRDVSFRNFHRQLRDYGDWYYSDRWGQVWQPYDMRFRPYRHGYWVDTDDYGWYWVSDEPFGDITYHYGRWVNDPDDGWLWVPGYAWSPAWVVWRRSGNYVGWMPMPPDRRFLDGDEFGASLQIGSLSISFNSWNDLGGYYGYGRWYGPGYSENRFNAMWSFVPVQRFGQRDLGRYALPAKQIRNVLRHSSNATNYTVVNNFIVNRGPADVKIPRVRARDVVRQPELIVPLSQSRQMRIKNDIPRGNGELNSAPKPTASQLDTLSTGNNPNHPGRHSRHLLDKTDAAVTPGPAVNAGNAPGTNGGGVTDEGAKKKDKDVTPSGAGAAMSSGEPDKKKHDEQQSGPGASAAAANPTDQDEVKKKKHDEQQTGPTPTPDQGESKKKHDEQQVEPAAKPAADNAAPTDQAEKKKKHEKPMPADAGSPSQQGTDTVTKSDQAASTTPSTTTDDQKAKKKKKHPDEPAVTPTPQQ